MIGFYAIGLVVLWIFITWLLWKGGRRVLEADYANRPVRFTVVVVVAIVWVGTSFWYSGGRKIYYDAQVRELCEEDGGVRVYESIKLPEERFDKHGNIGITYESYAKPSDEYFFISETDYIRKENPKIVRTATKLIRRSDGAVLGGIN